MKRILVLCMVLAMVMIHSVHAEDEVKDIFKDVVPRTLPIYEFMVRNPLYVHRFYSKNMYITDLKPLKGKILRFSSCEYELRKGGIKTYGDSGCPDYTYTYYFFDEDGYIKKWGVFSHPEGNRERYVKRVRTTYYADGVYTDEATGESPTIFLKGNYSYHYSVTKTDLEVKLIDSEKNQRLTFSKDTKWPEEPKERNEADFKRIRHSSGFVEYEYWRPKIDGDLGNYYEIRGEILEEPDEILLTYFSELF